MKEIIINRINRYLSAPNVEIADSTCTIVVTKQFLQDCNKSLKAESSKEVELITKLTQEKNDLSGEVMEYKQVFYVGLIAMFFIGLVCGALALKMLTGINL